MEDWRKGGGGERWRKVGGEEKKDGENDRRGERPRVRRKKEENRGKREKKRKTNEQPPSALTRGTSKPTAIKEELRRNSKELPNTHSQNAEINK